MKKSAKSAPARRRGPPPMAPHLRAQSVTTTLPPAVAAWIATLDPSPDREQPSLSAGLRVAAVTAYEDYLAAQKAGN